MNIDGRGERERERDIDSKEGHRSDHGYKMVEW